MEKNEMACRFDWLDDVADVVHVRTSQGKLVYANKIAQSLFGWPSVTGTPVDVADAAEYESIIDACRDTGAWSGSQTRLDAHGNKIMLESRWSRLPACDPKGNRFFVFEINVEEGRLMDENFVRAQRLESIGTLAGGVAHDINNVLGPILIGAEMIKRRIEDPWILKKLQGIEASAQRGAEIVKQVLDFSRGMTGEKIVVQPRHVLKELAKFAERTFSKSIRIESDFAAELETIVGDAALIRQMLLSLMVNARDAMPDGGTLTLRACNRTLTDQEVAKLSPDGNAGAYVCIEVEDTGSGIPIDVLDRMFEPFFTTKVRSQGTGLGLSTSLSIVKSHNGFFSVASTVGKGSVFSVYLPVSQAVQSAKTAAPPPVSTYADASSEESICILVVDDEPMMLEMNTDMLQSFGFSTKTAENGQVGLDIFMEDPQRIDVVVTDISMPIMNGSEMIQLIRAERPKIPVIAVSGLSESHHLSEGIELEGIQVLQKPYTIDQLTSLIHAVTSDRVATGDTLTDDRFDTLFGDGDSW